jgi:hypothetical protein
VFTGVTFGGVLTETAGKETLSLHCEDYMSLLEHTRLLNSPYYDGVEVFTAIQDLAKYAGITTQDNTRNPRVFCPCGYSWTAPRMKFPSTTTIKDAMLDIVKMYERIIYFDGAGQLQLSYLQGGIFGNAMTSNIRFHFYRMPPVGVSAGAFNVVLDEKRTEYKLASVVNYIYIKTTDRLGDGVIMVTASASERENRFPFRKQMNIETPVLGSLQAANHFKEMLKGRVFSVPRGISFKTVRIQGGSGGRSAMMPTDMFDVDGDPYRCMSITRSYDAATNSLDITVTGEYYGGSASSGGSTP